MRANAPKAARRARLAAGPALFGTALLAITLLTAACSNPLGKQSSTPQAPPKLSGSDVEKTIDAKIPPQFPKFDVGRAHCPDTLNPTTESSATCTITIDGQPATIAVTREGPNSKRYHVATTQALIDISQLEITLEHETKGLNSAHCGSAAVQVIDPPGTIDCTGVTTAGKTVALQVTIQNTDGKYSVEQKTD